jgi:hypothetical protein
MQAAVVMVSIFEFKLRVTSMKFVIGMFCFVVLCLG